MRSAEASLAFSLYGVGIRLDVEAAYLVPLLKERLPPNLRLCGTENAKTVYSLAHKVDITDLGEDRYWAIKRNGHVVAELNELDNAIDCLEGFLHHTLAAGCDRKVFVHAATVAWQDRAIVIPGHSFTGKSTLVQN
jgi:hypothetical protein